MVAQMDAETRSHLEILAKSGWYPDPNWYRGIRSAVASCLSSEDPGVGHELMCAAVDQPLESTRANIVRAFPARARFVNAALTAHERGEYAPSIWLLLAQADGICGNLLGIQLHSRRHAGNMKLVDKFGRSTDVPNLYVGPLLEVFPIVWNQRKRNGVNGGEFLNRHAVLHGESLEYDTSDTRGC